MGHGAVRLKTYFLSPHRLSEGSEHHPVSTNCAGCCNSYYAFLFPHQSPFLWLTDILQRPTGASNMILLPGNDWVAVWAFAGNSSAAMSTSKQLPISKKNNANNNNSKLQIPTVHTPALFFDVHQYLDDSTGTHSTCATDAISWGFAPLAQWLRCNGRQAFLVHPPSMTLTTTKPLTYNV
jgi:hypothetical protein